ncbi:aldehyde dehydrogenase [Xylogone sp. PMI_703]|nr:aldehyde dehydrogenase [Xylogone sp. PMI_703]
MATIQRITTPVASWEQPTGLFINNVFVKGSEGRTFETLNPATEKLIAHVHEGTDKDVDIAVAAARKALKSSEWSKISTAQRGRLLTTLSELFERDLDILAAVESLDSGKPISVAKFEVQSAADCLRYYGGWADKVHGKVIDIDSDSLDYTHHEPIGVCGAIIPWNVPLIMWSWKVGPALATGNTVVLKPAELTTLSALYAAKLVKEAGFPPGVLNIVPGLGRVVGSAIASHMNIDKVAFTGSTTVGRLIAKMAADSNLKKVTLELGGKSPNIVFDDANLEDTISWVNHGIFLNQGQICAAGARILVQEGIYDRFIERFRERSQATKVGDPLETDSALGPVVSKIQFDRIMGFIESGKRDGATVITGGGRHGDSGYFIQPTIFGDVHGDMTIIREEIFGPVCTIQKFKTEEEAIELANNTNYGLASGVHTTNLNTAIRVSKALEAGTVWVNQYNMFHQQTPFGGYKESGNGRELGEYALANYTEVKSVRIRTGSALF